MGDFRPVLSQPAGEFDVCALLLRFPTRIDYMISFDPGSFILLFEAE